MSKKISELTAAGALTGAEQVEVVQSAASRRTTTQDIANLAGSGISGLTTGRLPKAASATTLDDSVVHQNSNNIGVGTVSPDRKFHVEQDSAATNTVTYVQRITSTSSGTPANGIGVGLEFEVETSANNNEVGAIIETVTTDVTGGSEDFDLVAKQMIAGAAAVETFRITPTASSNLITYTLGSGYSGTERDLVAGASGSDASLSIKSKGVGTLALITSQAQLACNTNNIDINASGGVTFTVLSLSAPTVSRIDFASTNTVISVHRFRRTSSGTPANGIGVSIDFEVETASGNNEVGAIIESVVTDVTSSSEDFDLVLKTMASGATAAEALRIKSDKSTTFAGPAVLPSYTVAGVPTASSFTGGMIYVTNETGGSIPAFSDGTNWRRVTDRAIIS